MTTQSAVKKWPDVFTQRTTGRQVQDILCEPKKTHEQNNILCRHGRQGYSKQYIYTSFDDPFSEMYVNQNSKQGPPEEKTAEHPTRWGPKNLPVFRYTDYRIHRKAYRTFRLLSSHKLLVNPCMSTKTRNKGNRKYRQPNIQPDGGGQNPSVPLHRLSNPLQGIWEFPTAVLAQTTGQPMCPNAC